MILWALVVTFAIVVFGGGGYSILSRLVDLRAAKVVGAEQVDALHKEMTLLHARLAEVGKRADEALRAAARAESASNVNATRMAGTL